MTILFIVYHSVKRLSVSFPQCATELELSHWGLASCAQGSWAEDNVGEPELSYGGAACKEPALQTGRQEMGRVTPEPAQHEAAPSAVQLLSCLQTPPQEAGRDQRSPSVNGRVEAPAHGLLWSIQAHLHGDPSACLVSVWRLLQHTWNRRCCPSALSLPPAALTGENLRAQHKILLLTCGKAAVISLGEGLMFNSVCLVPLWTAQFLIIWICTVAVLLMFQEQ